MCTEGFFCAVVACSGKVCVDTYNQDEKGGN